MGKKPPRAKSNDWQRQLRHDLEFAKHRLREDGTLDTLIVIHPQGDGSLVMVRPDQHVSKDEYFQSAQLISIAFDAKAVSVISTAWMAPADSVVMPSKSERRQEVVVVAICYRDEDGERQWIGDCVLIERNASGKISGFSDFEADGIGPENYLSGDLLAPNRPTPDQITEAKQLLARFQRAGNVSRGDAWRH